MNDGLGSVSISLTIKMSLARTTVWTLCAVTFAINVIVCPGIECCELNIEHCSCSFNGDGYTVQCRGNSSMDIDIDLIFSSVANVTHLAIDGTNVLPGLKSSHSLSTHLRVLDLSNNGQETVLSNGTFTCCPNLMNIRVHRYSLVSVEAAVFSELPNLKELDLSDNNYLAYDQIMEAINLMNSPYFEVFNISGTHNSDGGELPFLTIPWDSFRPFLRTNIKVLDISWTHLLRAASPISPFLMTLEYVDISGTSLVGDVECLSQFVDLANLHTFRAQHWPNFIRGLDEVKKKRTPLSLSDRQANNTCSLHPLYTEDGCVNIPASLRILDLKYSNMDQFYWNFRTDIVCFPDNNGMTHLIMANVVFGQPIGLFLGLHKLEYFDFSKPDSPITESSLHIVRSDAFFDMPSLRVLLIPDTSLYTLPTASVSRLFSRNPKLQKLDMSHNGLRVLPRDIFVNNSDLESVNISWNSIDVFDIDMSNNRKLDTIDLTHNNIKTIAPEVLVQLSSFNTTVVLYVTQFVCEEIKCDLYNSLESKETNIYINCSLEESYIHISANVTWGDSAHYCPIVAVDDLSDTAIIITVCLSVLAFLLCSVTICIGCHCYRKKQALKRPNSDVTTTDSLNLESLTISSGNSQDTVVYLASSVPERINKVPPQFACFLAYSYSDTNFVLRKVYEPLQERLRQALPDQNPFTLVVVNDKNFLPGEPLYALIKQAVANSSVTIAAVSDEFVNSIWCNRELGFAKSSAIPIIPLYLNNCEPSKLTGALREIYDSRVRLKWPDIEECNGDELVEEESKVIDILCKAILVHVGPYLNRDSPELHGHTGVPYIGTRGVLYRSESGNETTVKS